MTLNIQHSDQGKWLIRIIPHSPIYASTHLHKTTPLIPLC
jgi:hypothetical protein